MKDFSRIKNPVKAEYRRLKQLTEKKIFEAKIGLEKISSDDLRLDSTKHTFSYNQQQEYNNILLEKVKNKEKKSSDSGSKF